jgi:predicted patatin/cPLA2 family phospholipase
MNVLASINSYEASRPKMALIAEGGGQRGIFTAGVLDAWLENDFDPFDLFIGTSAGSQNITSFLSRQQGYAKQLIRGLSRHKRFYQLGRGLVGGNVVDLDWYFDQTTQGRFALDFTTAARSLGPRELLITALIHGTDKVISYVQTVITIIGANCLKPPVHYPFYINKGLNSRSG